MRTEPDGALNPASLSTDDPAGAGRPDGGRRASPASDPVVMIRRPPAYASKTSRTDRSGSPARLRSWRVFELGPRPGSRAGHERRYEFGAQWCEPAARGRTGAPGTGSGTMPWCVTEIVWAHWIDLIALSALTGLIVLTVMAVIAVLAVPTVLTAFGRCYADLAFQ